MKTPMTYTPHFLCASLMLVFAAMMALSQSQYKKQYATISYEINPRLNQHGPKEKRVESAQIESGTPVFLKEDIKDEITNGSVRLTNNDNIANTENDWLSDRTSTESKQISDQLRYLVLAGTYTNNMILLSKQAQYENKGYTAQIIRFEDNKAKHICLGRFTTQEAASIFADKAASQLDISVHILDKAQMD